MKKSNLRKYKPFAVKLDNKAAYGLYLLQICREADEMGEALGRFIEVYVPTLEEFIEMRERIHKSKGQLKANKWRDNLDEPE